MSNLRLTVAFQSTATLLGVKFLDHLILGLADCEEGRGFVSVVDNLE